MTKPAPRVAILLKASVAPLLALLLLASCTGEPETDDLLYEVGAVEGYVLAAGQGRVMDVDARLLEEEWSGWTTGSTQADTRSDSTGWYRLELPTGRYRLGVHGQEWHANIDSKPDTVQIGPYVLRHDVRRGLAMIRLLLPQEWEGASCRLRLENGSYFDGDVRADVVRGWTEFVLPAMGPGSYTMRLLTPNSSEGIYLPGTLDAAQADVLVVGTDTIAAYEQDFSESYVTVSGRVTGSCLVEPSLQVNVQAFAGGSQEVASAYCDDEGSYQLILPVPLEVRLRFSSGSVEQWYGGDNYETATRFALQAGDRVTGIDLVESGLEIRLAGPGEVMNRSVRVRICDEAGNVLASQNTYDNPIWIGLLRPGRVLVQLDGVCNDQTWASQWFDGAPSPSGATPIDLAAGERRRLDVLLAEGGRITGRVLEADGLDHGSNYINLCDDRGERWCSWSQYTGDGHFVYTGLADGEYYLRADLGDGVLWWYPGTYEFATAAAIGIVDHGEVTGVSWTLPARAGGGR
ncbi:MAG: hypothetical protein Q7W56_08640 [Candidatus Latescibacteria bacterium]|nr:hypothetical protein [Candidatus Latescibacterota bacterium]